MIAAVSAALIGLISMQIYLLMDSYEQKEQAFDRNVLNALNLVSQQIEKEESASKIFNVAMTLPDLPQKKGKKKIIRFLQNDSTHVLGKQEGNAGFSWIISDTVKSGQGKQMRVEVFHSSGVDTMTSVIVKQKSGKSNGKQSFAYSYSTDNSEIQIKASDNNSPTMILRDTTKKRRGEIVAQVVDKLFLIETLPIEERLDLGKLDSLITQSLSGVGISLPYSFRVTVGDHDSIKLSNDSSKGKSLIVTPFKTRLFPNDVISPRYELALFLPDKSSFVLREMTMLLVMSLLFMSIIIASFIYTLRVIVIQKRLAASIIDFINNMTHEFKTPISTIALASEAIAKPDVLKSKPKILKYNSLIVDENNRMKHQVDTILQMAVLEEGEFELKFVEVDMHSIIRQAVKNISLQIEQRNGKITPHLNASSALVKGDALHLANIIHNVLDNAVKYSSAIPTITIETELSGSNLSIRITDNGIGITKEDEARVFDKYYRVSTGNTHDIKGFGLGLSYVKLIVEAHHGTVSLNSKIGEGTIVTVLLPIAP
ncbi:MAG: HAMP domain-containing sensor histidine kinase [Bacteroidota bacterium]